MSEQEIIDALNTFAEVKEDDTGLTYCGHCATVLLCDDCGDMPEVCPACGRVLSWTEWAEKSRPQPEEVD